TGGDLREGPQVGRGSRSGAREQRERPDRRRQLVQYGLFHGHDVQGPRPDADRGDRRVPRARRQGGQRAVLLRHGLSDELAPAREARVASGVAAFGHRAAQGAAQGALFGFFEFATQQFTGAQQQFAIEFVRQRGAFGQRQDQFALGRV